MYENTMPSPKPEEDNIEGNKINIEAMNKYEAEQRKERRQQMKLQCISLAISTASANQGMEILSENVVKAAKEYYKFVRT